MEQRQLVILNYHENFADNFTALAFAKILEKKNNLRFCYENSTSKRERFEKTMKNFSADFEFVSSKKVKDLAYQAFFLNKLFLKNKKLFNYCTKNNFLTRKHFSLSKINLINDDILNMFQFKSLEFIKNHDIYDKILSNNSVGIYLSSKDKIDEEFSEFLSKSFKRLNKYLKSPKFFIFAKDVDLKLDLDFEYEVVKLCDWREEFYFLQCCKHKIVPNLENSYSQNFWASMLMNKCYSYIVFQKNEEKFKKVKSKFENLLVI